MSTRIYHCLEQISSIDKKWGGRCDICHHSQSNVSFFYMSHENALCLVRTPCLMRTLSVYPTRWPSVWRERLLSDRFHCVIWYLWQCLLYIYIYMSQLLNMNVVTHSYLFYMWTSGTIWYTLWFLLYIYIYMYFTANNLQATATNRQATSKNRRVTAKNGRVRAKNMRVTL